MRVGPIRPVLGFSNSDPCFGVSAELEVSGHHSDDRVRLTAHAHRSSNHIRVVAKEPGPCAMTDNRNWSSAGLVVFRCEVAVNQTFVETTADLHQTITVRGNERNSSAFTTVTTAMFEPMPIASASTAMTVNDLFFAYTRRAKRRSWTNFSMRDHYATKGDRQVTLTGNLPL